jgi:hypothetical protein
VPDDCGNLNHLQAEDCHGHMLCPRNDTRWRTCLYRRIQSIFRLQAFPPHHIIQLQLRKSIVLQQGKAL